MQKYRIEYFHPITIADRWEELLPHIERVVAVSNNEFSAESIKDRALRGDSVMVVTLKDDVIIGVMTAEVVSFDSGLRSLLIPIVCGEDFFVWGEDWFAMMKSLAARLNCSELRGLSVRDGWLKKLKSYGWHENHVVITYQLDEELK